MDRKLTLYILIGMVLGVIVGQIRQFSMVAADRGQGPGGAVAEAA